MDKPWAKYLKLGIIHFMIFPEVIRGEGPVVETARKIAEDAFFDVLEVTRVKDAGVLAELGRTLEVAHMDVGFGAQPGLLLNRLSLASLDEATHQRAIADVKMSIDQAYFLGAKLLALFDGPASYPGPEKAEAATRALAESLEELCAYAEGQATDYTLTISLENFDQTIDKKSLIGPTQEAARVAEAVKRSHPSFGLTVDLSHLPLLGETSCQAVEAAGEHLVHVHIGNCIMRDPSQAGYGDNHPRFGAPGGENDVPELVEFLKALFAAGFFQREFPTGKPVVSFEVKPLPGETPELVIASSKRAWQRAWAELAVS